MNIELLRFKIVPNCYRNHQTKFEIDRTILTKIAIRYGQTDVRTDVQTLIIEKLRFLKLN